MQFEQKVPLSCNFIFWSLMNSLSPSVAAQSLSKASCIVQASILHFQQPCKLHFLELKVQTIVCIFETNNSSEQCNPTFGWEGI